MMLLVWSYRTFYIPVSFFFVSNHAGSLMFLARLCILEPFSFRDGWRDGGRGGGRPNRQSDGWRKGRAEGWCRKTREAPEENCRDKKSEEGKAQGSPAAAQEEDLHFSLLQLL